MCVWVPWGEHMRVLLLYDYPPCPSGLATQGSLLHRGLQEMGVDVHSVHLESAQEKEWYYRWFKPDVVLGVGYWGHTPSLVLHPQRHGVQAVVPWLVADGYMANYQEVLESLRLILVTSQWVKSVYMRDGLKGGNIEVLPGRLRHGCLRPAGPERSEGRRRARGARGGPGPGHDPDRSGAMPRAKAPRK